MTVATQSSEGTIVRNKQALTEQEVVKIAEACRAEAKTNNWSVSIVIVDEGGYLLGAQRLDGAGLQTPEIALGKARTAALTKQSTLKLEEASKERPATLVIGGRLPVQGGVPIILQGDCLGAIGVSGVQSSQDERIALAGLASIGL